MLSRGQSRAVSEIVSFSGCWWRLSMGLHSILDPLGFLAIKDRCNYLRFHHTILSAYLRTCTEGEHAQAKPEGATRFEQCPCGRIYWRASRTGRRLRRVREDIWLVETQHEWGLGLSPRLAPCSRFPVPSQTIISAYFLARKVVILHSIDCGEIIALETHRTALIALSRTSCEAQSELPRFFQLSLKGEPMGTVVD